MVKDRKRQNNIPVSFRTVHTDLMTMDSASSFVGRSAELTLLETALASAVAGSPRTMFVAGEAGVGKTRLVAEFSIRAQAQARVLTGGCFELSGGGLPYGPIVEALRELLRSLDTAARDALLGSGYAELTRLLPIGQEQHGWRDQAVSGGSAQARLFELVLHVLDRLGEQLPVVLVVEDLHWADRSTLDLLTFLVHNLHEERILIVGTYRSDELYGHPHLRAALAELNRSRHIQRVELASFQREELAAQLRGILGAAPPAAMVDRVFARSEGNAFFVEELVAAGMGAADVRIPPRLRDVIIGRFEALSEDAKDVLRVVAVAGRRVGHPLVAVASGLPERALLQALREAVAQHFVVGDADDGTYIFRHELAREAIYADLLPGELAQLHAAVARELTADPRLAGDQAATVAAELAHHWYAAHDLPRALTTSIEAARSAVAIYAFAEAQRQLERALELWGRVPDAAAMAGVPHEDLLQEAADVALGAGDVDQALALVREALAKVDPARAPARAGVLQERLGHYLWRWGDSESSLAALAEANRLFASEGASPERARVLAAHGRLLMIAGRYSASRTLCEQAVAMARTIGARREEGNALNTLGVNLTMLGDPDAGVAALLQARSIADELQIVEDAMRAFNNLSTALESTGRLEEAADVMLDGLARARELDLELTAGAPLLANAADQLFMLGRWEEEDHLLRKAPRLEASTRYGSLLSMYRGELAMALGRFDESRQHLQRALRTSAHLREPQFLGPLYSCLAEHAIWRQDRRAAATAVREGLRLLADSEAEQLAIGLCALGIRAEADEAEGALEARAIIRAEAARSAGAALLDQAQQLIEQLARRGAVLPVGRAMLGVCQAEHTRLEGRAEPERWEIAAASWDRLSLPYRAAYARWRQAQALLVRGASAEATAALHQAHAAALRLGAEPLRRQLELLAEGSGIELQRPAAEARR
jgi:tetratricopeptide (TPR) repeat protein